MKQTLAERFAHFWTSRRTPPDVFTFLKGFVDVPPAERLEVYLTDQRFRWQSGSPLPAERYCEADPELFSDPKCKAALVYGEFSVRQERGEPPDLDEMRLRFPDVYHAHIGGEDPSSFHSSGPVDPDAPFVFADFLLQREVGAGAMGKVFAAYQKSQRRHVALKILKEFGASPLDTVSRFLQEGKPGCDLQHPNIVRTHGLGRLPDGGYFLVMDLINGPNLAQRMKMTWPVFGEVVQVGTSVAQALEHAHQQGVVHRDIKPSNILLDADGKVMVSDFGIAQWFGNESAGTVTPGQMVGTPNYMAPEQADPRWGAIGPWTDVYGLGGILYEMLVGRTPFEDKDLGETIARLISPSRLATPPRRLRADVPPALEAICMQCLQKSPTARIRSAREVADFLRNCPK